MSYLTLGDHGQPDIDPYTERALEVFDLAGLGKKKSNFLTRIVKKVGKLFGSGKAKAEEMTEAVSPGLTAATEAAAAAKEVVAAREAAKSPAAQIAKIVPYALIGVGGLFLLMTLAKRKRR